MTHFLPSYSVSRPDPAISACGTLLLIGRHVAFPFRLQKTRDGLMPSPEQLRFFGSLPRTCVQNRVQFAPTVPHLAPHSPLQVLDFVLNEG